MTPKTRCCIFGDHALAIVGDANQSASALFDIDHDLCGPRIERILDQLLDDRRGTLDDLTGSNAIGNIVWKDTDASHNKEILVERGLTQDPKLAADCADLNPCNPRNPRLVFSEP